MILPPGTEKLPQPLLPILKNPFDIPPHEKPVNERITPRTVAHAVTAKRAAIPLLESVRVASQGMWAAERDVHEPVWRIPLGDLRAPTER